MIVVQGMSYPAILILYLSCGTWQHRVNPSVFSGGCERVQSIGDRSVNRWGVPPQQLAYPIWQSHEIRSCDLLHSEGIPKEVSQSTSHGLLQWFRAHAQQHNSRYPQWSETRCDCSWVVDRFPHILTQITAMATPQIRTNPEIITSTYVTKPCQLIRTCYVTTNSKTDTVTIDKVTQYDIRKKEERKEIRGKNIKNWNEEKYHQPSEDFQVMMKHNMHTHLKQNGAVPPLEASLRCLRTASGVIDYVKHKERRGILVDENVRHSPCLLILLCACNIMWY